MSEKRIYAAYDEEGVFVYQAYAPYIVKAALAKGTFDAGFSMTRMTWIKPSFAWMLYRSGYATKENQEAILKVKLSHEGFMEILGEAVASSFDSSIYKSPQKWKQQVSESNVRFQWDPERYLTLGEHPTRRAIQLGLRDWVVKKYVKHWIIGLEEVTDLAHQVKHAHETKQPFPPVPEERLYPVSDEIAQRLGIREA
jgi:hypothetical protein